jgi:hypothetical protein
MSVAVEAGLSAHCAFHPGVEAIGTCQRCGTYYCSACSKLIGERTFCQGCLSIPGVDYLRELRERYWGKRDGWVWYNGFLGAIAALGTCAICVQKQAWGDLPLPLFSLPISVAYFGLKPAARLWLFAECPLALVMCIAKAAHLVPSLPELSPVREAAVIWLAFLLCFVPYLSTRNRLAFKLEVSERDLANLHRRVSNATATRAFVYAILALVIPLLGLLTLSLGVIALRRANNAVWPPVGGRGRAITSIVLSGIGLAGWAVVIVLLRR